MRRSSPVQQWLDSLPTDTNTTNDVTETALTDATNNANEECIIEDSRVDTKSEENKADESVTENTVIEATCDNSDIKDENGDKNDDKTLDNPIQREAWKRNSLESGLLSNTPQVRRVKNKLQRDHSIQSEGCSPRFKNPLFRDHSLQSDASGSSGSSVLNVLGARKVDAESVLLALGFGPSEKQQKLQRIPDRFLVPSKLQGISTEQFIKDEHHSMRMHDCGVFGYRGLTGDVSMRRKRNAKLTMRIRREQNKGLRKLQRLHANAVTEQLKWNPHVPPSTIVAKIMECILHDDVCREEAFMKTRHSIADMRSAPAIHAHLAARLRST